MASDLLSIGASGARAARGALEVTANNIANASTDGYVRRSVRIEEVSGGSIAGRGSDISVSGSRVGEVRRNADSFRQAELRRTQADLERANVELSGLQNIEAAVEQAGIFDSIVEFEATLQQLTGDPTDSARRAAVVAEAETLASKFNITAGSLASVRDGLHFNAQADVENLNTYGAELARVNLRLARSGFGSNDQAALLDQRDNLLERMSALASVSTTFASDGTVAVGLGASPGTPFVAGGTAGKVASAIAADGTMSFTLNGQAVSPASGSLTGAALALGDLAAIGTRLDAAAESIATTINAAQANGVALDGSAGQPMFAGTTAASLRVVLTSGSGLATAPAGSPANDRNQQNLTEMRQALSAANPAEGINTILFDVSSKVAGRQVTQGALETIASSARIALEEQSGVDLDNEAANLIRYQQAFQASGRAMQVASDIFDTLLGVGR
ncbi:flagellar hook-associated protein FlgK [Alteriqipengyuania lutimaris]|uniref:Flagellar hook-associated protein 1 n=1 Tax=Alteriqipengyuania lutimaris TaxID=1538146 RepID=A0A395LNH6_9SPHN|nr:flagellar hook-associated protein FlgK [Alteriqipengyuania lutimaris]MBB3033985.1 flagellar hook-associated protein 1 FlgK [Alteriqipengyuania lutimaris]RDS77064.1 flagellar hook-associated protein FlgK [Alteriqipengyuania lutimaris]